MKIKHVISCQYMLKINYQLYQGEVHYTKQIKQINASMFECCASYIKEEFKKRDLKFSTSTVLLKNQK